MVSIYIYICKKITEEREEKAKERAELCIYVYVLIDYLSLYIQRSRSMTGARAERNEFLLLHEFHRQKYICPDKQFAKISAPEQLDPEFDADEGKKRTNFLYTANIHHFN